MKPLAQGFWLITLMLLTAGCGQRSTNTAPIGPEARGVSSPCPFTTNGVDDSAALRTRLQTCNWVQIQSPTITLLNPVILKHTSGAPIQDVIIEPAPSITGTIQVNSFFHANLVAGCSNPQLVKCFSPNPSRAAFEYDGSFSPGFVLNAATVVGATSITINTPLSSPSVKFVVGDFAYINDATTTGMVGDGTMELRQVTNVTPAPNGLTATLTLDRALNRPHKSGITVAHAVPILNTIIRNLKFNSISSTVRYHPRVGIHLHLAKNAYIREVTSTNWEGFSLVLLDTGGIGNRVRNTFAVGTGASDTDTPPQRYNGWGIGVEGQEGTSLEYSGASHFSEAMIVNYSFNTSIVVPGIVGSDINYGVRIWHGVGGNIGHKVGTVCSFFGPTLNTTITRDLTQPATAFAGQILNTQTSISYGFGSKASTQVDPSVNINTPTSEALVTPCP